ncbi:electron transfer flavoprotein beta subunit [Desulfuromusa kysingii]|uniref:Protein FixA n=1 Tax=Desulfuromusa kysingii TaxID=37625 RepID=A0A1H4C7E5_9BACT|nr:putative electron transfer flavoprotein FixA [Desulfuromusa kysingii]SEA56269.1 electron transfer flavoprotein beta subunit [Desulfuromusa kysingii]
MNIIACIKVVPEEQDIAVLPNQELSFDKAQWKIGQYDLSALEAGKQLAKETGGSMKVLTIGGDALSKTKIRKDILSRGADELNVVITDQQFNDSLVTAKAIVKAVKTMNEFDLLIFGTGSSDLYSQQVGNQVGAIMDLPVVNEINDINLQEGIIRVERVLEGEVEVLEIPLPAVISVTSEINVPTIPGMRDIMSAGKKKVNELSVDLSGIAGSTEVLNDLAPEQKDRKLQIVKGDTDEMVDALIQFLNK